MSFKASSFQRMFFASLRGRRDTRAVFGATQCSLHHSGRARAWSFYMKSRGGSIKNPIGFSSKDIEPRALLNLSRTSEMISIFMELKIHPKTGGDLLILHNIHDIHIYFF